MANKKRPPATKLQLRPGESVWEAMAREISNNPDSPASLQIQSAVRHALEPNRAAVQQVLDALKVQHAQDGVGAKAAVDAAIAHWERAVGTRMTPDLLRDLQQQAREQLEAERRRPPAMESILQSQPQATDVGYDLGVHLHGLQGTWHRLWASMCLCYSFGGEPASDETVATVRGQFEQLLGREMESQEFGALAANARVHYEKVMRPRLGDPAA